MTKSQLILQISISTEFIPPGLNCINPKFSNLLAVSSENAFTQKDKVSLATCTISEYEWSFNVRDIHYNVNSSIEHCPFFTFINSCAKEIVYNCTQGVYKHKNLQAQKRWSVSIKILAVKSSYCVWVVIIVCCSRLQLSVSWVDICEWGGYRNWYRI